MLSPHTKNFRKSFTGRDSGIPKTHPSYTYGSVPKLGQRMSLLLLHRCWQWIQERASWNVRDDLPSLHQHVFDRVIGSHQARAGRPRRIEFLESGNIRRRQSRSMIDTQRDLHVEMWNFLKIPVNFFECIISQANINDIHET